MDKSYTSELYREAKVENKTYIQILIESQHKKVETLNKLLDLTREQTDLLDGQYFAPEDFTNIIQKKEIHIKRLDDLDNGFENLFEKAQEELTANKYTYKNEIEELKETITRISEISTELELKEKTNKKKLETYFALKKKEVKDFKKSKETANNYQRSMNGQDDNPSFFFDTKK